jgi:hypothetical protein
MTSTNAAKVHEYDRGLLWAGMAADVTVLNAADGWFWIAECTPGRALG